MLKKVLLICILIIAFSSCTRDDICSEATQTTSKLVINFKNFSSPLEARGVGNLTIISDLNEEIVIDNVTSDSINIPLHAGADFSSFQFIKFSDSETDTNTDVIRFDYQREDIYVNRACSFRTIFSELNYDLTPEDNNTNWIQSVEILNNTVENENEAHITIYH